MKSRITLAVIISFFSLIFSLNVACAPQVANSPKCTTKARALLDVGSGTLKMALAEVEVCSPGKSRILHEVQTQSVALALEANKDSKGSISKAALSQLQDKLSELKSWSVEQVKKRNQNNRKPIKEIEFSAVATHAIRTATNKDQVLSVFASEQIPLRVLSQRDEGLLGVEGVHAEKEKLKELCPSETADLVVWDIGGGSAQISHVSTLGAMPVNIKVSELELGSESFKKKVLALVGEGVGEGKSKSCPTASSPNPLGKSKLARIRQNTNQWLNQWTLTPVRKEHCAIGIGSLHVKGVEQLVNKHWSKIKTCVCQNQTCEPAKNGYELKHVQCLAEKLAPYTDCDPEIAGPYSTTLVTNLLMIEGLMKKLGLAKVNTLMVNMTNAQWSKMDEITFSPGFKIDQF